MKVSKATVAFLASLGEPAAIWHLAFNNYLNNGGHVTSNGLLNLRLAKIEARMNSIGQKPPKKSLLELSLFV